MRSPASAGSRASSSSPILPAESIFHYRNKLEYSFTQEDGRRRARLPPGGRWDEVLDIESCWLTTDLGNAIRNAVKDGRARGPARLRPGDAGGVPPPPRRARRAQHRSGARRARHRAWRARATERFVDAVRRFPEVRSIHWAVNDTPAEVTNVPTRVLWGDEAIEEEILGLRFRVRPNAFLQTNTAMGEHLYRSRSSTQGSPARRRSTTSTAARDDRALHGPRP